MDDKDKFWLGFWAIEASVFIVFLILVYKYNIESNKQYIDAGYEQVQIHTSSGYVWQKKGK